MLIAAPFLFMSELPYMRQHGVMLFFKMTVFLFFGCIVSLAVNHAQFYQVIRGVSITGIMVCMVVVGHYLLRNDPIGLRWYFVGNLLSMFICVFIFQRSVEVTSAGGADVETIMAGKLFWIQRLDSLLSTPILVNYLGMPLFYSAGVPLFIALFSITTSYIGLSFIPV